MAKKRGNSEGSPAPPQSWLGTGAAWNQAEESVEFVDGERLVVDPSTNGRMGGGSP